MSEVIEANFREIGEEKPEEQSFFDKTKEKARQAGSWVKDKTQRIVSSVKEDPIGNALLVGTVCAGLKFAYDVVSSIVEAGRVYTYDARTDNYIELKRKPKNNEIVELSDRMAKGQTKLEALRDMNLIK